MDFLDPKKQKQHRLVLFTGYGLIAIAIAIVAVILLYQADGYGVDKKGQVVRNGLVFVSSQPVKADISLNNVPYKSQTNTRMVLPSNTYTVKLTAAGYRSWQRQVVVLGGDVQRFDYPVLFPSSLQTKDVITYEKRPLFTSQSPDHRWLLVKTAGETDTAVFSEYDLKTSAAPLATSITLPADAYTAGDTAGSWEAVEWSSDNKHVLLLHTYTAGAATDHEYIVLDRSSPESSLNVTRTLNLPATETLSLFNKKYNQYYAFDTLAETLRTTSLDSSVDVVQLEHVVAFKSYASDTLLYATTVPPTGKATEGKVSVVLRQGQKTYTLRTLSAASGTTYDLDLAQYSGDWYIAVGSSSDAGVYLYRNPRDQTLAANALPAPWRFMRLAGTTRVSFSSSAQFILFESGQQFVVYDAENVRTYRYVATQPLDSPQAYAAWMDDSRVTYVSGGKQLVFDYDYTNAQFLESNIAGVAPVFDPSMKAVYSFAPATAGAVERTSLTRTSLIVAK